LGAPAITPIEPMYEKGAAMIRVAAHAMR